MLNTRVPTGGAAPRLPQPSSIALGLFFTVLAAAGAAPVPDQPPPGDSVAALRDLLVEDAGPDLAKRKERMNELIGKMELEELSRVLLLQDWRTLEDQVQGSEASQRRKEDDAKTREAAAERFRQKAKEAMKAANEAPKGSDPQARTEAMLNRAATADLIGETAAAGRKLDYSTFASRRSSQGAPAQIGKPALPQIGYLAQQLSDLTPYLIELTKLNDPVAPEASADARRSAARALGQIQPADPKKVVEALALILADKTSAPGLRIVAAESMDHLAQAASVEMGRSLGLDENIKTRFLDLSQAVWQAVLQQGLAAGQPIEVRRRSLHAFNQITTEMEGDIGVIPESNILLSLNINQDLLKEFQDQADRYNSRLAEVFSVFEKNAEPLAAAARDRDPEVRLTALSILIDLAIVRDRLRHAATGTIPAAAPKTAPPTSKDPKPEAALFLGSTVALVAAEEPAKEKAPAEEPNKKSAAQTLLDAVTRGLEKTIDALKQQLTGPDPETRRAALKVLEILGDAAFPAVDAITQSLRDPDRFVRWTAARTLGDLAQKETDQHKFTPAQVEAAAKGIAELLRDQDVAVRLAAATSLGRFGARAAPAGPPLIRTLNHSQTDAARNLVPNRTTEPDLVKGDPTVRIAAFHALQAIDGDTAVQALPEAVIALGDNNIQVRQAAAEMIGRAGVKVSDSYRAELIRALSKTLADQEGDVLPAARRARLDLMPLKKK